MTQQSSPGLVLTSPSQTPPSALTKDQKRRVEALKTARSVLVASGLTGGPAAAADDVIKVADYILHGKAVR